MSRRSKSRYYHSSQAISTRFFSLSISTHHWLNSKQSHLESNSKIARKSAYSKPTSNTSKGFTFCQVSPSICPAEVNTTTILKQIVSLFIKQHSYARDNVHRVIPFNEIHILAMKTSFCGTTKLTTIIAGFSFCEVSQSICPTEASRDTTALEKYTPLSALRESHALNVPWIPPAALPLLFQPPPCTMYAASVRLSSFTKHYTEWNYTTSYLFPRTSAEPKRTLRLKQQQKYDGNDIKRPTDVLTSIPFSIRSDASDRERYKISLCSY